MANYVFLGLKSVFRLFKKQPEIIDLGGNDTVREPCIFIANHSAAGGPFTYQLYFPHKFVPWGTHEMCGNYKERWNYLYHVFYQQKLRWHKVPAGIVATLFAIISKFLYNGAELIPTYRDARFVTTIRRSLRMLERGRNILIFPENSTDGYHEILKEYHPGFAKLASTYYRRTGKNIPIYAVYYSEEHNRIVIDKPVYIESLLEDKLDEKGIANRFCERTNELFRLHIAGTAAVQ